MNFFKQTEVTYSGTVERIGVVQASEFGTCYALLLKGESQPQMVNVKPVSLFAQDEALAQLRIRIALTAPGDNITIKMKGSFVVEFQNFTLEQK